MYVGRFVVSVLMNENPGMLSRGFFCFSTLRGGLAHAMRSTGAAAVVGAVGTADGVVVAGVFEEGGFGVYKTDLDGGTGGGDPAVVDDVAGFAFAFGGDGTGDEEGGDPVEGGAVGVEDVDVDATGEDAARTGAAANVAADVHDAGIEFDGGGEDADLFVLADHNFDTFGGRGDAGVSFFDFGRVGGR
jgi:hypothetical protein